ncbi:hypothetical protein DC522_19140 [Microvirga sp. KLBC 81]|uniref:CARDB domain-containing protein n=1 Tax=Microvirga sp. KLBC 81 TaxID=1862707 RepID=UPI000D5110AC|nr:CARDB domain-containing protein [Microvirga sp. KLBC 81]PVE22764.1 hypothetical protein DC522_19140 [Microvirga sp. KLBC 81]
MNMRVQHKRGIERCGLYALSLFVATFLSGLSQAASAQPGPSKPPEIAGPVVRTPVTPQVRQENLNALTPRSRVQQWRPGDPVKVIEDMKERLQPGGGEAEREQLQGTPSDQSGGTRLPPIQATPPAAAPPGLPPRGAIMPLSPATAAPPPVQVTFDGIPATGFLPPDTVGDVGRNHYIQMVNTAFAIFDKAGNLLAGPLPINALWTGFGGACESENNGDPIVRYDRLADRWLISQFALPGPDLHECIAISRTGDPVTGGWFLYDFPTIDTSTGGFVFPDYPKIGVWPDAYYMGTQRGFPNGGLDVWAFDRQRMLAGQPAGQIQFHVRPPSLILIPSDLNGPAPPTNTPNTFARHVDGERFGGGDRLELFDFRVDWGNPANSTFALTATLPTAPFDTVLCEPSLIGRCIPQPATDVRLESLTVWLMWRLQYRNFGSHESLVVNHTVDENGQDHAGIRWYELRRTSGGSWSIFQQGNHAPDREHRWMGSAAMDSTGNIALGYSVSSPEVFPSIRYAMRVPSDPPGTLGQGEATIIAGSGAQTHGSGRWGNYSSLDLDPTDDCTFWYTSEYYPTTSVAGWRTRVASFKHPDCGKPRVAFKYAAKIVCGVQDEPGNLRLARGFYATAINIHNPNSKPAKFTKKLSLTYPPDAQEPGAVYNISTDTLKPDEALEVDCEDLKRNLFHNNLPTQYIKGFIVIKSNASLDVTGVYTTRSLDAPCCPQTVHTCCESQNGKGCCSGKGDCCGSQDHPANGGRPMMPGSHSGIHVEQIHERRITDETDDPRLPDLIPVPKADRPYPPEAFCRIKDRGLLITVRNQGEASADASVAEVLFTHVNASVVRPTPPLSPGNEIDLHFAFPPNGCTGGLESCPFRITVDQGGTVTESNESNNTALGSCIFLQ